MPFLTTYHKGRCDSGRKLYVNQSVTFGAGHYDNLRNRSSARRLGLRWGAPGWAGLPRFRRHLHYAAGLPPVP
jgi:hypothetical protein